MADRPTMTIGLSASLALLGLATVLVWATPPSDTSWPMIFEVEKIELRRAPDSLVRRRQELERSLGRATDPDEKQRLTVRITRFQQAIHDLSDKAFYGFVRRSSASEESGVTGVRNTVIYVDGGNGLARTIEVGAVLSIEVAEEVIRTESGVVITYFRSDDFTLIPEPSFWQPREADAAAPWCGGVAGPDAGILTEIEPVEGNRRDPWLEYEITILPDMGGSLKRLSCRLSWEASAGRVVGPLDLLLEDFGPDDRSASATLRVKRIDAMRDSPVRVRVCEVVRGVEGGGTEP